MLTEHERRMLDQIAQDLSEDPKFARVMGKRRPLSVFKMLKLFVVLPLVWPFRRPWAATRQLCGAGMARHSAWLDRRSEKVQALLVAAYVLLAGAILVLAAAPLAVLVAGKL
jgi:uncharacterized membrane protein (DUF485 family)